MIKIFFNKKNFISVTLIAVLSAIVISIVHVRVGNEYSLVSAFLMGRDGCVEIEKAISGELEYQSDVSVCLFNLLIILPFLLNIFSEDLKVAKSFVFIRIKNTSDWFRYKYLQMICYCLYYSFIYNFTIFLTVIALGFVNGDLKLALTYVFWGIFAQTTILLLLLILGSMLSIIFSHHMAASISVLITTLLIILLSFANKAVVQYHILCNYFISWHTVFSINSDHYSLPIWFYYALIIVLIILEFVLAKAIISKKDFV